MIQCPGCGLDQFVYVRGPRRTTCPYCKGSWVQDADHQIAVSRAESRMLARPPASRRAAVP